MESQEIVLVSLVLLAFHGGVDGACSCPQLTLPTGLYFTDAPSTYAARETIAVACSLGYVATGGSGSGSCSTQCSWTWGTNSVILQCTRGCLAPNLTQGVEYVSGSSSTSYLSGASVSLKCSTNYGPKAGSTVGNCSGTTFTWTWAAGKQLECDPACPAPALTTGVEFASGSSSEYTLGDLITLRCGSGYVATDGSALGTCLSNNTWKWNGTGMLQCTQACPTPTLLIGTEFASGHSSVYTLNDIITLTCSSGYTSTGGGTLAVCLSNSTWQWNGAGMLQCSPACFPPAAGVNATISPSFSKAIYLLSETIQYECVSGYVPLSGSSSGVCSSINLWTWQAGTTASLSCVIAPPYKDRISDTFKPATCERYVIRSTPTSATCLISCLNDGYCRGYAFVGTACYLDRPLIEATASSLMSCFARQ